MFETRARGDEILDQGGPQQGQTGMLIAFGAGVWAFAALINF